MNFKERGITIGDLVILTIILISTFAFFKIKDSKYQESAKLNFVCGNLAHKIDLESKQDHL